MEMAGEVECTGLASEDDILALVKELREEHCKNRMWRAACTHFLSHCIGDYEPACQPDDPYLCSELILNDTSPL